MPPPIQWEACSSPVDSALSCQQMKLFWTTPAEPAIGSFPRVWPVPGSKRVLLQFSRNNFPGDLGIRYHLVAEADGPVLHALLQINPPQGGCYLNAQGLQDGKYLWGMQGDTWDEPGFGSVEGFLAGDVASSTPTIVFKRPMDPGFAANWDVTRDWVVENYGPRYVRSWDTPAKPLMIFAAAEDPIGLDVASAAPFRSAVFLSLGTSWAHDIAVWTPDKGVQPWQRWGGDFSRGAGNLGTDGQDIVWTYGEGKAPTELEFPATSVFTAPYTTDASTVEVTKRRVRSDVTRPADVDYQYVVGCGYAARRYYLKGTSNLFVVRLSDGRAWKIPGAADGEMNQVHWANPLAVSCEHVYVSMLVKKEGATIARIPLSSLGEGLPAD
jgi:hypothetical protein